MLPFLLRYNSNVVRLAYQCRSLVLPRLFVARFENFANDWRMDRHKQHFGKRVAKVATWGLKIPHLAE